MQKETAGYFQLSKGTEIWINLDDSLSMDMSCESDSFAFPAAKGVGTMKDSLPGRGWLACRESFFGKKKLVILIEVDVWKFDVFPHASNIFGGQLYNFRG